MNSKDEKYLESIINSAGASVPEEVAKEIAEVFNETGDGNSGEDKTANIISKWYNASLVNPTEKEKYARCIFTLAMLKLKGYGFPNILKGVDPSVAKVLRKFNREYNIEILEESKRVKDGLYIIEENNETTYTLGRFEYESKYIDVFKAIKPCNYASAKVTVARKPSKKASAEHAYRVKITKK